MEILVSGTNRYGAFDHSWRETIQFLPSDRVAVTCDQGETELTQMLGVKFMILETSATTYNLIPENLSGLQNGATYLCAAQVLAPTSPFKLKLYHVGCAEALETTPAAKRPLFLQRECVRSQWTPEEWKRYMSTQR
jgi:hypothetical protein